MALSFIDSKKYYLFIALLFLLIIPINVYSAKITGYVIDQNENLLRYANVKVVCDNYEGDVITDDVGFFEIDNLTDSKCRFIVIYDGKPNRYDLEINQEMNYVVEIKVKSIQESYSILSIFVMFLLVFIILFFANKYIIKKVKKETKEPYGVFNENLSNDKLEQKILNEELDTIMKVLSENEKIIVEEIRLKGPLTQSQLRHYTGFPKSTLHRLLRKLQDKNVLVIKEEAGIKKVYLSDSFRS